MNEVDPEALFYGPSAAPGPYKASDPRISTGTVDRTDIGPGCKSVTLTLEDGRVYKHEGHAWPTEKTAESWWTPSFIPPHLRPAPFVMPKRHKR